MTDAEIIKALECCTNDDNEPNCKECTKRPHIYCICELLEDAYELIQRQQERIERLKDNLDAVLAERAYHTEAVREFADNVVEQLEKASPEPTTKIYVHENEYTAAFEMHEKCVAIVKGAQNE